MQHIVNIIRFLIFGCVISCLTLDASIVKYTTSISSGPYVFGIINDLIALGASGYYLFTMEKQSNNPPTTAMTLDYAICAVEALLWFIYAIVKFTSRSHKGFFIYSDITVASGIYGLIIFVLYVATIGVLYQWSQKLGLPGPNLSNIGNVIKYPNFSKANPEQTPNNPNSVPMSTSPMSGSSVGMNNPGFGINNPGVGMNNPGVGMNSPGVGTNSPGYVVNNPGVGFNNPGGYSMNNSGYVVNPGYGADNSGGTPGYGVNNSGFGMNPVYGINNSGVVNNPNNPVGGMNNPGVGTNNSTPVNNSGTERNSAAEYYNAGSEHNRARDNLGSCFLSDSILVLHYEMKNSV